MVMNVVAVDDDDLTMQCAEIASRICSSTETLEDNVAKLLTQIVEHEPHRAKTSLEIVLKQLDRPGQPKLDSETRQQISEYIEQIASDLSNGDVKFPILDLKQVEASQPNDVKNTVAERTFPVNSAVVAARFLTSANNGSTKPSIPVDLQPKRPLYNDSATHTEDQLKAQANVSRSELNDGTKRSEDKEKERKNMETSGDCQSNTVEYGMQQWIIPACLLASAITTATVCASKETTPAACTCLNKRRPITTEDSPHSTAILSVSEREMCDRDRPKSTLGLEAKVLASPTTIEELHEATVDSDGGAVTVKHRIASPEQADDAPEIPDSMKESVARARASIREDTPEVTRCGFYRENDTTYEDAARVVSDQLGHFGYAQHQQIASILQDELLRTAVPQYHSQEFSHDSTSLQWLHEMRLNIAWRIDHAKGPSRPAPVARRTHRKRALSPTQTQTAHDCVIETVENNTVAAQQSSEVLRGDDDKPLRSGASPQGRKRNYRETSPRRDTHRMNVNGRQSNSRKKQRPQIAFGRRVYTSDVKRDERGLSQQKNDQSTDKTADMRTSRGKRQEDLKREASDEDAFVDGLMDLLLDNSSIECVRSRPSREDIGATVSKLGLEPRGLSTNMHLPIDWDAECAYCDVNRPIVIGSRAYDPVRDIVDQVIPMVEERAQYVSNAVKPTKTMNSDELLSQFFSQLAEKDLVDSYREQALNRRLYSLPASPREIASSVTSPDHHQSSSAPCSRPACNKLRYSPEEESRSAENRNARARSTQALATNEAYSTQTQTRNTVLTNSATACPQLQEIPRTNRLWRPESDFNATYFSEEDEATSSKRTATDLGLYEHIRPSTVSSKDAETSERSNCSEKRSCLKDSLQWKQFRKRHYKAQRQKLIRRHGIYDPLLLSSDSESKTTSESAFSLCFNQNDLEVPNGVRHTPSSLRDC